MFFPKVWGRGLFKQPLPRVGCSETRPAGPSKPQQTPKKTVLGGKRFLSKLTIWSIWAQEIMENGVWLGGTCGQIINMYPKWTLATTPSMFQQPLPRVWSLPGIFQQPLPRAWGLPGLFKQPLPPFRGPSKHLSAWGRTYDQIIKMLPKRTL